MRNKTTEQSSLLATLFVNPLLVLATALLVTASPAPRAAEPGEPSTEQLAKDAQNPLANLISIPFQNNVNFGVGPANDQTQDVLNIQPVVPVGVAPAWNLITRTIIPLVWQPSFSGGSTTFGLGDVTFTAFLSPAHPGDLIWGVGPVATFPTATSPLIGSQSTWGLGPSAVALTMPGPWVLGVLANNVWSIAGADANAMTVQYFVNYNFGKTGWYLTSSPSITANWDAPGGPGEKWTVPFGGGIGKLLRLGKLPVNTTVAAFYNVVSPDFGPQWSFRAQATFLLPTSIFK